MATTTVTCKSCRTQVSVTTNISTYRCSICSGITHLTPRAPGPTDHDHSFSLRNLTTKFFKDYKTLSKPYSGYLNDVRRPTTAGNKRALLCGVTYNSKKYMLKGTVNDVMNMKGFLQENFCFPNECIRVLTGN